MRHVIRTAAIGLLALTLVSAARPPAKPPAGFDALVDQFFDRCLFPHHPSAGTAQGFHQYDAQLEDYSKAAIAAEVACLKSFQSRFEAVDP